MSKMACWRECCHGVNHFPVLPLFLASGLPVFLASAILFSLVQRSLEGLYTHKVQFWGEKTHKYLRKPLEEIVSPSWQTPFLSGRRKLCCITGHIGIPSEQSYRGLDHSRNIRLSAAVCNPLSTCHFCPLMLFFLPPPMLPRPFWSIPWCAWLRFLLKAELEL